MYCPQCRTQYRDGFYECADCHVPLKSGAPPERREAEAMPDWRFASGRRDPRQMLDVVTVLEVQDTFGLSLAKAALDDAGIDYMLIGEDPRLQGYSGAGLLGEAPLCEWACQIQVRREDEARARELLEPLKNPEPLDESDIEQFGE